MSALGELLVTSGVARNLIWGVYVLIVIAISKRVNVPHVNKTVTDFGGIYTIYAVVFFTWCRTFLAFQVSPPPSSTG